MQGKRKVQKQSQIKLSKRSKSNQKLSKLKKIFRGNNRMNSKNNLKYSQKRELLQRYNHKTAIESFLKKYSSSKTRIS